MAGHKAIRVSFLLGVRSAVYDQHARAPAGGAARWAEAPAWVERPDASIHAALPARLVLLLGLGILGRTDVGAVPVGDREVSGRADQTAFAGRAAAVAATDAVAGAAPAQSAAWSFSLHAAVRFGVVRPDQLGLEVE